MNKGFWKKYALAVYLFIFALSIIFGLIGYYVFKEAQVYQTLLFSVSTELLGAFLIFILVKQIFRLDDDQRELIQETITEFKTLKVALNQRFNSLVPRDQLRNRFNIGKLLPKAGSVYLLGYTHSGLFRTYKREIINALNNNVKFKVILVDFENEIRNIFKQYPSNYQKLLLHYQASIKDIEQIKSSIKTEYVKNLSVYRINWIPSCELIIILTSNDEPDYARVRIQPISFEYGSKDPSRILVIDSNENPEDYSYFLAQFNKLLNSIEA